MPLCSQRYAMLHYAMICMYAIAMCMCEFMYVRACMYVYVGIMDMHVQIYVHYICTSCMLVYAYL